MSRAPKLAIVLPTRHQARVPSYWLQILYELDELDVPTEVIHAQVRTLLREGDEVLPSSRAIFPSVAFIRALLRSPAPVFLCAEYGVATLVTAIAARFRGRQTIIFQEHTGRKGLGVSGHDRLYRQLLGVLVHAFVANTDAAHVELADVLGIDQRKIFRATVLVPPERGFLSRESHPLPPPVRRPLFLFVGRLLKLKNLGGLLDATAALRTRGFEFEVWIVGDGPERHMLEEKANQLIDEGVVRFLGSWPNTSLGSIFETADVFVMPSFRDYRSVAVLEALRFGKLVIDSVHDGNAGDFVRHERTGFVFDPYVPRALEAAMDRAITEADTRRELGQRASALMEEHTPQTAAAALREILATVRPT